MSQILHETYLHLKKLFSVYLKFKFSCASYIFIYLLTLTALSKLENSAESAIAVRI